jgi:hypothetical protein
MWVMKEFDHTNIQNGVTKDYITQDQANVILSIPQYTA